MFARKGDNWIRLIGLFKLGKGLLFLLIGLGLATFIGKDTGEQMIGWMRLLSLGQENRYIGHLLSWAIGYDRHAVGALELSILVYALLLLTESAGLLLLKRWAEYLTALTTASFIPLEVWSDLRRFGLMKTTLLLLNVLTVWYLSLRLWPERRRKAVE